MVETPKWYPLTTDNSLNDTIGLDWDTMQY